MITILIGMPIAWLYFGLLDRSWVPDWLSFRRFEASQRVRYFLATYLGLLPVMPLVYFGGQMARATVPTVPSELILVPLVPLFFLAKYAVLKLLKLV